MAFFSFLSRPLVLDRPAFSQKELETLFTYILLDDVPHPHTPLPQDVLVLCRDGEVEAGYRLSWQLLERKVDFPRFRRLVAHIARSGEATEEEQKLFKDVRARFKHMRFACANFCKRHHYPLALHIVTILMGNMQDAFKNRQRKATLLYGIAVWLALSPLFYWLTRMPIFFRKPDTPQGVRLYQQGQMKKLAAMFLAGEEKTGHEFHNMRKIISRYVAFNDTLRTIRPSPGLDQLSEYLATINGMMGGLHDDLVQKKLDGTQDYRRDKFTPPEEIKARLETFLKKSGVL